VGKKGDWRWTVEQCHFIHCSINKMTILEKIVPTKEERTVVGTNKGQGCTRGVTYRLSLSGSYELIEERSFETSESISLSWLSSIKVGAGISSPEFFGASATIFMAVSQSMGVTQEYSSTRGESRTKAAYKKASASLKYFGPGAGVLIGYVEKYIFDASDVKVLYHGKCWDGEVKDIEQEGHIHIKGTTFGNFHFMESVKTELKTCGFVTEECLKHSCILNDRFYNAPQKIMNSFEGCYRDFEFDYRCRNMRNCNYLKNMEYSGENIFHDVVSVLTETSQKCYNLCKLVSGCNGVTWADKNHGMDPLRCWLKRTVDPKAKVAETHMISIDLDAENLMQGFKYVGSNIRSPFVPVHGEARDCVVMCTSVMGCQAAVLLPRGESRPNSHCLLKGKGSLGSLQSQAEAISVEIDTCTC